MMPNVEQVREHLWEVRANGRTYSGVTELTAVYAAMYDLAWREDVLRGGIERLRRELVLSGQWDEGSWADRHVADLLDG